jgi:glutathione synthase/RimK-type ligase-like ATP-grasp enzyme
MSARLALVTWDAAARPHGVFQAFADGEDGRIAAALAARGVLVDRVAWSAAGVDWGAYDLVWVRTVWDYFDHLTEFRAWLARAAAVAPVWNPPEVVSWNADKRYLFDLEARGVRLPPTAHLRAGVAADLAALLAERGWGEVVVKRVVTAAAAGQERFAAGRTAAAQAHLDALLAGGDALVQPYLPSVASRGETSLVAVNGAIIHAVRKVPAAGEYRSQPNFGSRVVLHDPTAAERALAARALAAVGAPTLHARVDMVALDDGAPALMELELIEPYLFLDADPAAVERLVDGVCTRL